MIPESFQVPILIAAVIALVSSVIIPVIAVNDRMEMVKPAHTNPDTPEVTSCALPPELDIREGGTDYRGRPLSIDDNTGLALETATFALG